MKLSLATRIFLGYAVVLVTFGAVSIFAVAELHQNQAELRLLTEGYLPLSQESASLTALHQNQRQDTRRLLGEENADGRAKLFRLAQLNFPPLAERLAAARARADEISKFAPPSEGPFLRELSGLLAELGTLHSGYVDAAHAAFAFPSETAVSGTAGVEKLEQREASIGRNLRRLQASLENRIRERAGEAERRERRTGLAILALSLSAIALGLLAAALSAKALRPVRTLIEGVSRIGRGDYSAQLGVRGEDEIAVLAREFDAMATSLRDREAQLHAQQEALLRAEQFAAAGRISAQVAHEVRNPLSSIGLNVELLEEAFAQATFPREETAHEAREILSAVTREVDRLADITEDYLRMARVPRPMLMAEDVNGVLQSVLEFSREELSRSKVEVVRQLDPGAPRALADEGQ
ncbi:MAG TPA: histidine kinase dimerization/phospho-acceptor domain-containing protein, partial [Myxococcaceae bacterium]|nr:histidine kinase dimerization/phospho-acceptor domain-containing protein [Myxococcaceae bacterium]